MQMFKGIFFDSVLKRADTLPLLNRKPFRHASVFKTRVSTRACPFLKRAFSPIYDLGSLKIAFPCYKEEHSMDQYRSRLKLSENFERQWSILVSGEIHMDQSLVHTFSWGNSYGPMVLKVLLKFPPYTGIGPWMALPVVNLFLALRKRKAATGPN